MEEALLTAAWAGNSFTGEEFEILLKHGAKVEAYNDRGLTALMIAAANGHAEIVEVMLRHGANVNKTTFVAWTEKEGWGG
ncbi:MAG: ankyrin repeat domain-containing protein [Anditalea sp.]